MHQLDPNAFMRVVDFVFAIERDLYAFYGVNAMRINFTVIGLLSGALLLALAYQLWMVTHSMVKNMLVWSLRIAKIVILIAMLAFLGVYVHEKFPQAYWIVYQHSKLGYYTAVQHISTAMLRLSDIWNSRHFASKEL